VYATPPTRAMEDDDFKTRAPYGSIRAKRFGAQLMGRPASRANRVTTRLRRRCAASAPPIPNTTPNSPRDRSRTAHRLERSVWAPCRGMGIGQLLAMTTYVKAQSHGMPVNVSIDGPAHATYEEGKTFYQARRANSTCRASNATCRTTIAFCARKFESRANERLSHYRLSWQASDPYSGGFASATNRSARNRWVRIAAICSARTLSCRCRQRIAHRNAVGTQIA